MRAYVASSHDNADEARAIAEALEQDGWKITYRWFDHGSVQAEGEARIREVATAELDGVIDAELVVVALPGARGTHAELGAAAVIIRLREKETSWASVPGPNAVIIYGRGETAMRQLARDAYGVSPEEHRRHNGALHDTAGRTCAFYLAPGVHLVEKDRGLDGLRLEALRVTKRAPEPRQALAAEVTL